MDTAEYRVKPLKKGMDYGTTQVPGSKSITNRALLLAAFAEGKSCLYGVLFSDDTKHCIGAIRSLGIQVDVSEDKRCVTVHGRGGQFGPVAGTSARATEGTADIYVGSGGTTARFLSAMLSVVPGVWNFSASEQMTKRPMKELLDALQVGGATVSYSGDAGFFPFTLRVPESPRAGLPHPEADSCTDIKSAAISVAPESSSAVAPEPRADAKTLHYTVDGSRSSQFLSGLLMMGAVANQQVVIDVAGVLIAKSYVDITLKVMESFGVIAENHEYQRFVVPAKGRSAKSPQGDSVKIATRLMGTQYTIEPDVSGACYFFALPALLGGTLTVAGVESNSMQGDIAFLEVLEKMGCTASSPTPADPPAITVERSLESPLQGITTNMNDLSDQTLTLGAIAPFAVGTTKISGVGHIRHQESDRLTALATELKRMGVATELQEDGITIESLSIPTLGQAQVAPITTPNPVAIETYEDHRMAMAFTLPGLLNGGVTMKNPNCCDKTFPNYFDIIDDLTSQFEANYYLLGFMGVGKSTVGRTLAQKLGRKFIDLDAWIEETQGRSIPEIFSTQGEAKFRKIEHDALLEVSQTYSGAIIATGGGIVENSANLSLLQQFGQSFYLADDFDTLYARISGKAKQNRPLAAAESKETLLQRYQRRDPLYRQVCGPLIAWGLPADGTSTANNMVAICGRVISRRGKEVPETVAELMGYVATK